MIKQITKNKTFHILLFIIICAFAFIRSDCSNTITNTPTDITGTWELVKMLGNLQDVCLQEIAQFENGTATLQCPGVTPITRQYTFENNVLTFTSTGVSYDVSFFTENNVGKMELNARGGVQRTLTYDKISK